MDPVSNVDQLVLLLRQRLAERARTAPAASRRTSRRDARTPLDQVQALAGADGVDDGALRRALVQSLLVDRFGAGVINEARFQQIVDQVTETLEADAGVAGLLGQVVAELRAQAR